MDQITCGVELILQVLANWRIVTTVFEEDQWTDTDQVTHVLTPGDASMIHGMIHQAILDLSKRRGMEQNLEPEL